MLSMPRWQVIRIRLGSEFYVVISTILKYQLAIQRFGKGRSQGERCRESVEIIDLARPELTKTKKAETVK